MVTCTTPPFRAAVRLNSGVRLQIGGLVDDKERMHVPLSVEYLFSDLFGKLNYHGYVGSVSVTTWRKDLLKTTRYIRKAIEINVHCDSGHKHRLLEACDRLLEHLGKAKTIAAIHAVMFEYQTRIIFLLLGNMPDHWRIRSPYSSKFWQLDGHRTLQYQQSASQKAYLLINLVDIRKQLSVEPKDYHDLHDAFYRGCNGDPDKFLEWFKSEFPVEYCSVF